MSMRTKHREALNELGVEILEYIVGYDGQEIDREADTVSAPKIWGTELRREANGTSLFIEWQTNEYGGSPAYYLRTRKGDETSDEGRYRRKQDAIAGAIGYWWA
jgi:hypothetical protein